MERDILRAALLPPGHLLNLLSKRIAVAQNKCLLSATAPARSLPTRARLVLQSHTGDFMSYSRLGFLIWQATYLARFTLP